MSCSVVKLPVPNCVNGWPGFAVLRSSWYSRDISFVQSKALADVRHPRTLAPISLSPLVSPLSGACVCAFVFQCVRPTATIWIAVWARSFIVIEQRSSSLQIAGILRVHRLHFALGARLGEQRARKERRETVESLVQVVMRHDEVKHLTPKGPTRI